MAHAGTTVKTGDPAPLFELPNPRGDRRSLSGYFAQGPVLLAFHRGIW